MRSNRFLFFAIFLFGTVAATAQQKTSLPLKDAVHLALSKSNEIGLANSKVNTKKYELQSVKNNQYPDFKLSGQYLRLTSANVNLKTRNQTETGPDDATPAASPETNQLLLGQANMTLPLFSGLRLKNSIAATENLYKAEQANAAHSSAQITMRVIRYYAELYKVQQSIALLKESLKSNQQRVIDFTALEQNGIIARNDLLKAQLQVSRVQLSVDEAEKNERLLNYNLITLLQLPANTQIEVSPDNIGADLFSQPVGTAQDALGKRKDLEALRFNAKATESNIKFVKGNYFPSIALVGGYTALNLQNVVTVTNALNIGLGFSYNLSSLFKNGTDVKVAESKAKEIRQQEALLTDAIKSQVMQARENYELSIRQSTVYNEAVGQATENYRIVKDKYDNGLSNTNDLLEADVEALSAKINVAYAQANKALKFYELLEASGTLTESFKLSNN
jgi:outer membrane protein TolC